MKDNIEKIDGLISGINKICEIIKPTFGVKGSNVTIEESIPPFYRVTNDGKSIVDAIKLADPIENIGASILRESTNAAEKESGDGRKTTCLLTQAILNEATKLTTPPLDVKRSLDACIPLVFKFIDEQKRDIEAKDVHSVATISCEDPDIGKLIGEIYTKIGREGIIEIDMANLPETYYEISDGVRFRSGYFGAYSTTEEGKAIYKNPRVLVTKDKITSVEQLENLFKSLSNEGINELVIFCEDIDLSVATRLAITHLQGGFKTLVIKAPILWKDWNFDDFGAITGAKVIDSKEGKNFSNIELSDLGMCDKIVSSKDETRVVGIKDISAHIENIKELALTNDQQKLRLVWLQTKVATLKVGANSESELNYKLKKSKDACSSSYWALKGGVVKGGGLCLQSACKILPNTIGGRILKNALRAPRNQIIENSGDMYVDDSVQDSAIITKNCVKNSISIAGIVLTSKSVITLK